MTIETSSLTPKTAAAPDASNPEQPFLIPIITASTASDKDGDNDDKPNEVREWAMLDINGELIVPKQDNDSSSKENDRDSNDESGLIGASETELGTVEFVDGNPVMILGSHQLKGTLVDLKQPFCVLQKRKRKRDDQEEEDLSYEIVGVVKRKLLFNQYPKIIMR